MAEMTVVLKVESSAEVRVVDWDEPWVACWVEQSERQTAVPKAVTMVVWKASQRVERRVDDLAAPSESLTVDNWDVLMVAGRASLKAADSVAQMDV